MYGVPKQNTMKTIFFFLYLQSHRVLNLLRFNFVKKKKVLQQFQCLQMLADALWENYDWHGRHFASALPASIVWDSKYLTLPDNHNTLVFVRRIKR